MIKLVYFHIIMVPENSFKIKNMGLRRAACGERCAACGERSLEYYNPKYHDNVFLKIRFHFRVTYLTELFSSQIVLICETINLMTYAKHS
jgi:hypothetical protein